MSRQKAIWKWGNCKKTAPPGKRTLYAICCIWLACCILSANKKNICILIRRHAAAPRRCSPALHLIEADWLALNSPGIYLIDICAIIKYLPYLGTNIIRIVVHKICVYRQEVHVTFRKYFDIDLTCARNQFPNLNTGLLRVLPQADLYNENTHIYYILVEYEIIPFKLKLK